MTPVHVVTACIPVLLIIFTPLFPFASNPGLIFGIPTMIVWMSALVVAIVVILQVIDRQITRREDALAPPQADASTRNDPTTETNEERP